MKLTLELLPGTLKECRFSSFKCSSISIGALPLQCSFWWIPYGVLLWEVCAARLCLPNQSAFLLCSIEFSKALNSGLYYLLLKSIGVSLLTSAEADYYSKSFCWNLSVSTVLCVGCPRRDWSQQHFWSLSLSRWSLKFLSTLVQQPLGFFWLQKDNR